MLTTRWFSSLSCSALALACGGEGDPPRVLKESFSAGVAVSSSCEDAEQVHGFSPLEDFESGIASQFYTNNDGTSREVNPVGGLNSPLSYLLPTARCEKSLRAFRQTAQNLTDWGWVLGINFPDAPRDLSRFRGVSFWVRRGDSSGKTMFLSVVDRDRDPVGQRCVLDSKDVMARCDPYGVGFGIEEDWTWIQVDFADLKQRAFGASGLGFVPEAVMGLSFAADRGDWDIQIDDIGFYE